MKEVIKTCLDRYNNTSHSNDELSNLIINAIKTKGWYLNLSDKEELNSAELDTAGYPVKKISKYLTADIDKIVMIDDTCQHGNDLNSICSECDEQQMRDIWVCGICNESTYDVDYDYVGSGTNHLGCELEIEMKDKENETK